jgi:four helix bundle protein
MIYDLEERTIAFSKRVINFCGEISKSNLLKPIATQLIRSATSIGANYCEANGATTKKDFRYKAHLCKKEAQETRYWLRVLGDNNKVDQIVLKDLFDEATQLIKIFATIAEKSK